MKINASEIHYDSISQFSRAKDETLYTMNRKGDFAYKDKKESILNQKTQDSVYYQTRGTDTVEIRDKARTEWVSRKEVQGETGLNMDDDLEKNIYLGAVFSWAADTIDLLVSEFQKQGQEDLTRSGSRTHEIQNKDIVDPDHTWAATQMDQQIALYREMASKLREKADALRPVMNNGQASQLKRVRHTEMENTLVRTMGLVETEDGQTIHFSLDVGMERRSEHLSYETIQIVDPLVINFKGTAAQLSDQKMDFDLDGDGNTQTIARLKSGSGFLALDLNNDNQINNGKELFGPTTGDGFRELSFYDQDQNHWIDENDPVYEQLMVWSMDSQGKDVLKKLSESGIGAIHLGRVSSDFSVKDNAGGTLGQISSTGIALTEGGAVKSVQQIDFVV